MAELIPRGLRVRSERTRVLIASWLDRRHADRIAAAEPERIELIYEPELLPTTRYEADHHGPPRDLSEAERRRWRDDLSRAEVMFEFDWERPEELRRRSPRRMEAWKARRHWERFCGQEVAGSRMTLLGLGRVGARIAVSAAAGIEVTGYRRTAGQETPPQVARVVDAAGTTAAVCREAVPKNDAGGALCRQTAI